MALNGIDSETVNDEAGRARLVLIACSDGTTCEPKGRDDRITSERALHYVSRRRGELWTFFGDYDVNFWLRDLHVHALDRLRRDGWVRWRHWRIHHIPRRLFEVWDTDTGHFSRVYDAFPFVQCSFVTWLEQWGLASARDIAAIRAMKEIRGNFSTVKRDAIRRYTFLEVECLRRGVLEIKRRVSAATKPPPQWLGPGAVAGASMRLHRVRQYMPDETHERAPEAYFGGRIETSRVGMLRPAAPLHAYDLNSAYPAAAVRLPCFAHSRWRKWKRGDVVNRFDLVRVKWNLPPGTVWGPFPVRSDAGTLVYPRAGAGWYWGVEVAPWASAVEVTSGWRLETRCTCRPFAWLADVYEKRRALKKAGDPAEYALKLVLNSAYG